MFESLRPLENLTKKILDRVNSIYWMSFRDYHPDRLISLYNFASRRGQTEDAAAIMGAIASAVYRGHFNVRYDTETFDDRLVDVLKPVYIRKSDGKDGTYISFD